jgi:hypothetical protein
MIQGNALVNAMLTGAVGGKTELSKVIESPAMALDKHQRNVPLPLSAVLYTIHVCPAAEEA